MNILLLGGSGFIGKEILKVLCKEKAANIMVLEHKTPIEPNGKKIKIISQSLSSLDLQKLPLCPDIIIHAARCKTGRFGKYGRRLVAGIGKRANRNLLKQINKTDREIRLIYLSGSLMYGSSPSTLIHENFPLSAISFAREYVLAEEVFLQEINKGNKNILMLRLPWVIGAGSWFEWNYMRMLQQHNTIPLYGKGENRMTFIDVRDVAKNVVQLCHLKQSGILNLFHPDYMTQKEFTQKISLLLNKQTTPIDIENNPKLTRAVKEAFNSDMCLGSNYPKVQSVLQQDLYSIGESLLYHSSLYSNSTK